METGSTKASFFIDALDGRGGVAFASLRGADLTAEKLTPDSPSWHLAAPDFEPVPLGSRATGLAATARMGFQLGLSMDGEAEVAFPTLEALADYVRRLYLSGGGGDGTGGIGPDWPEGDPDGGGEAPRSDYLGFSDSGHHDIRAYFKALAQKFVDASGNLASNPATAETAQRLSTDTGSPDKGVSLSEESGELLGFAGLAVTQAAQDLQTGLIRLPDTQAEVVGALQEMLSVLSQLEIASSRQVEMLVRTPGFDLGVLDWPWHYSYGSPPVLRDPMDTLGALPVPRRACEEGPSNRMREWRSLKDLFFDCLGHPPLFVSAAHPTDRIALVWLAAVILLIVTYSRPIQRSARDVFYREVLEWVMQQMPTYAFTPDLEETIQMMGRT